MSITRCKNSITISGATEGRGRQGREDREQKERRKKLEWSLSTKEEARQTLQWRDETARLAYRQVDKWETDDGQTGGDRQTGRQTGGDRQTATDGQTDRQMEAPSSCTTATKCMSFRKMERR